MTPPMEPSKQPTSGEIKFSKKRLALAIAIAGISAAIGALLRVGTGGTSASIPGETAGREYPIATRVDAA